MTKHRPLHGWAPAGAIVLLALVAMGAVGLALADEDDRHDDDHERARRALARGEIRALADILAVVGAALPGRVIEVDLEREHGAFVYEFTVVSPEGWVREVMVDAHTAEIVAIEDED
ncbi:PepSY domain-containing protein [Roseospira visakhapatnamensis]|uniref:Putative membrane protein YkoI n=1 Tax=Roseospira visakhapatnamensis TaxID=390880 RepID=A0A7W6RCH2_9PROT|nr:PepSY domain-containing protein [Roseospira visakhapatnamensis]MBB4265898.1 putative membrane protein YkoI [Roseospira visakhapatnamensis]